MADDVLRMGVDLLVVGGGMAGLTAAAFAARRGTRVMVVEKGPEIGGSALLSNGYLWTVPSLAAFRSEDPDGDTSLAQVLVGQLPALVEWVRSTGVDVSERISVLGYGTGHRIDIGAYLARCRAIVESAGGWIVPRVEVERLLVVGSSVTGARAKDARGDVLEVEATTTLLATGGFQGDRASRERYLGSEAGDGLLVRSNPHSMGDGLRLALEAGAVGDVSGRGFYGHLVPAPLAAFHPKDFLRLALLCSDRGVLVNERGERFTEEARGDHHSAQAVLRQPGARAVLVVDDEVRQGSRAPFIAGMEQLDPLGDAEAVGANVAVADSVDALAARIHTWGFDRAGVERSLGAAVGRVLSRAPFTAVEAQPAITFTYGGIAVDEHASVLGSERRPITGLKAAGADIALYRSGYAGGLALAGGFALRALT
ncbi:MAG: FAD-dependent oxidoreductase [Propionibacteriales bacterium]|nr:FAD-dependent oxidoreductase [Propionibacteriales bacterium]